MKDYNPENVKKTKIQDLHFNPRNPKDNEAQFQRVKRSVEVNGLLGLIFTRTNEDGLTEIVDGNQRTRAAKELGYKEVYTYDLGKISQDEADQLVLYLQTQVPFDAVTLAPIAVELAEEGEELPFSLKEMEEFKAQTSFDFETAYLDQDPIEAPETEDSTKKEAIPAYKIKLTIKDHDFIMDKIKIVKSLEKVNDIEALQLLLEAAT